MNIIRRVDQSIRDVSNYHTISKVPKEFFHRETHLKFDAATAQVEISRVEILNYRFRQDDLKSIVPHEKWCDGIVLVATERVGVLLGRQPVLEELSANLFRGII